jgi:beta-galactosidase
MHVDKEKGLVPCSLGDLGVHESACRSQALIFTRFRERIVPQLLSMSVKDRLLLGAAWYPEQETAREWARDAALMRDLGLDAARIGEFAWSRMQRADGTQTLDWLERVLDTLARHGLGAVLCTPTACPPVWLWERYPDLAPVHPDGSKRMFGGRRHASLFHPAFREHALAITDALGRRFGHHPAVLGWQLDNEVGTYCSLDCSEAAQRAFQAWLKHEFGTVHRLNEEWRLIFWNQEVERFDQVPAPTIMPCPRSPQHVLAYNRFCHEGMAHFLLDQARTLRAHLPPSIFVVASATWPVLERLYARQRALRGCWVDSISVHHYPELLPDEGHPALHLALLRSLAPEHPLRVLEHQIGSSRSTAGGLLPEWRRLWAMECLANGARTLFWFHWRRFRTGCEWRHSAILERDRRPREVFRSLQQLLHELRRLDSDLNGATPQAGAQILVSPLNMVGRDRSSEDSFWMEIQQPDATHARVPMWMRETARAAFNPLHRLGLSPCLVQEEDNWNPRLPLIATDLDIIEPPLVQKLERFCQAGGTFVCFPGAGERNRHGAQRRSPPPGLLSRLFGVELEQYVPLDALRGAIFDHTRGTVLDCAESNSPTMAVRFGREMIPFDVRHGEILALRSRTVRALGFYAEDPCQDRPAVSLRRLGKGQAIYLGAVPATETDAVRLYRLLFPTLSPNGPPVRLYRWTKGQETITIVINEQLNPVPMTQPVRDRLTGRPFAHIPARGVLVSRDPIRFQNPPHDKMP